MRLYKQLSVFYFQYSNIKFHLKNNYSKIILFCHCQVSYSLAAHLMVPLPPCHALPWRLAIQIHHDSLSVF